MTETWLVLGASSSVARAFSRVAACNAMNLILAGRDQSDLQAMAADCHLRGAPVAQVVRFDARDPTSFDQLLAVSRSCTGLVNVAVFTGSMPDQSRIDADPSLAAAVVADNYLGPMHFLQLFAPLIEERAGGTVIGVCSVAGDRGRIKNYVYGSTKAAFATYLSGLRNRLTRSGGHVVTVKPGFMDTAMSWGHPGMFLVASPDSVANTLWNAVARKKDVIYAPFFWRYIMLIIRNIPERIFKRLSI